MKDIDFDELDKAVNSLMSTAEQVNATPEVVLPAAPSLPAEPTVAVEPVAAPVATTAPSAPQVIESTVGAATNSTMVSPEPVAKQPSLATKRSGRFMDVVHPSSDMRVADKPDVSRTGASVAPVSTTITPEPVLAQPSSQTPETPVPAVEVETPTGASSHEGIGVAVDTVDAPAVSDEAMADELSKNAEAALADELASIAAVTQADTLADEPLSSPFIPDAKVEKRPLGGVTAAESEKTDEEKPEELAPGPEATANDNEAVDESATEKASETVDLPPELHQDIAAVEATVPSEAEEPAQAISKSEVAAGGSIAPQYKEATTTVETKHEALYDSAAKGAPLAHPAKKKSGWSWVVWIILLILVGAGSAAAIYYLKLI